MGRVSGGIEQMARGVRGSVRRSGPSRDFDASGPQEKLIAAAIELFSRRGYEGVSTGAIAEAAGLTQSMVHYHFGSKLRLWESAIEVLMRRRGSVFPVGRLETKDLDPIARLKYAVRSMISVSVADPHLNRIIIHESMARTSRLRWIAKQYMLPGYQAFDASIQEAVKAGAVKTLPVADVTNLIVAASVLTHSIGELVNDVYKVDVYGSDFVASFSDTVIEVLFDGLQKR